MAEWVYLLAVFAALTVGYLCGYFAGSCRTDAAPTEHAWINVRRYSIDMNKECALREMELTHEEQMAMIERGCFDGIEFGEGEPEEDEDDGED